MTKQLAGETDAAGIPGPLRDVRRAPIGLGGRARILLGVLAACLVVDQITKIVAAQLIPSHRAITLFGDFLRLQYVENAGAMLGLGSALPRESRFVIFVVMVAAALLGLLFFSLISRNLRPRHLIGISLIIGGGTSNLIDRMMNEGVVRDFMNVGIGELRTGIFNVADMVILTGLGVLLVTEFAQRRGRADATRAERTEAGAIEAQRTSSGVADSRGGQRGAGG